MRLKLGPARRTIREIGLGLITAGVVLLLFILYQLFGTNLAEAKSQQQLKKSFQGQSRTVPSTVPPTIVPTPTTVAPLPPGGEAVAHLVIPKIGVDKFVVEGTSLEQLRKGPGHYVGTSLPGQPGNAAIAGHRTTYGAPFYRLNELQPGDDIFVTTHEGHFRYVVFQSEVVKPTEVEVLDNTPDDRLTLTTCNPRFSAATRLVVISRLADPPVRPAKPPGPPRTVRFDLGGADQKAWGPTLMYGSLLVGLWVSVRLWATRTRRGRHARTRTRPGAHRARREWSWLPFLAGIPICLVPMWFFFENVVRLLPANI
jgi:sortase A